MTNFICSCQCGFLTYKILTFHFLIMFSELLQDKGERSQRFMTKKTYYDAIIGPMDKFTENTKIWFSSCVCLLFSYQLPFLLLYLLFGRFKCIATISIANLWGVRLTQAKTFNHTIFWLSWTCNDHNEFIRWQKCQQLKVSS